MSELYKLQRRHIHPDSGVTSVGDTRGSKLMVSFYFFLKRLTTFFSHRPLESDK